MATITKGNNKSSLLRSVRAVATTDNIVMKGTGGSDVMISKADFKLAIWDSTGGDTKIDCGDRMTGTGIIDLGTRI